ncbi:MAG: aldehyde dehydrogenase family protein [Rickettsiales bacterium]|nr:aldehyde dehydrogenase family protein [Rickettsiales bacterium]
MTKDYKAELSHAFEENDFKKFDKEYLEFLTQFDSFKEARSATPTTLRLTNPIFGADHSFFLKQTNDEQAEKTLKSARNASKVLAKMSVEDRLDFMSVLEKKMAAHQEEIALTISADTGKPVDLSAAEVSSKGKEWFDYAKDEAAKQLADKQVRKNVNISTRPLGAAQIIGAFNYPYALAIGGIVGALTAGNGVVVSAPLKAPNWVFPFMQAAKEAVAEFSEKAKAEGKPWADDFAKNAGGIIQTSVGVNNKLTGEADVVHFVGSDFVGNLIRKNRGDKRTIVEMGGSNVVAVMKSAVKDDADSKKIAQTLYDAFGPATGQRCTAPRIICVQEGAEGVTDHIKQLCDQGPGDLLGNPFKAGVKMGPMVDRNSHQRMGEAVALAQELGAEVHGDFQIHDNEMPQARSAYWVRPVVIDWTKALDANPDNAKRIYDFMKGEIFGPFVHIVHPVKTLDQAIEMTNKLDDHGLAGAIFSNDPAEVRHYQDNIKVTSLAVNGAPKDVSPYGEHGHPGLATIGGTDHFGLYSERYTRSDMGKTPLAM